MENMPINEELLKFITWRAVQIYDRKNREGLFNLSCWSAAYCAITGRETPIDGYIICAILTGRNWVELSPSGGNSYWKFKEVV